MFVTNERLIIFTVLTVVQRKLRPLKKNSRKKYGRKMVNGSMTDLACMINHQNLEKN